MKPRPPKKTDNKPKEKTGKIVSKTKSNEKVFIHGFIKIIDKPIIILK